jgi:peptide/nickel transport system ATP-binding protein/oligopeptide transport system ATP-binding protein
MIFQDPFSSLSPRMQVEDIIGEPLHVHRLARGAERQRQVLEVMDAVGLAEEHCHRYPHEFSGGQRQRIAIARALILKPRLIVADEPVSALDASIQSQILNLLMDLQQELQLTYLFIAHDLNVIYHVCDRVLVMYLGKIVESAEVMTLFEKPRHPYTRALIAAKPELDASRRKKKLLLKGTVPSPSQVPPGCAFHPRCPLHIREECREVGPRLVDVGEDHLVRCHLGQN